MSVQHSPVEGVDYLLQANPGPMTLDGTQSYAVRGEAGLVIVDPGDDDAAHQGALAALGPVTLILVTHRHHDHVGGLARLRELTGAPSRALAGDFSAGAPPLRPGELLDLGPLALRVLPTPGHTSDSLSLLVERGGAAVGVLTGDTILGRGTTIIDHPDGRLDDYLESLETLRALGPVPVLPAHGGFPGPVDAVADAYLQHRLARLGQVRAALVSLHDAGRPASVAAVTDIVYADVDASVRRAAEHTVSAQLALLERRGEWTGA